LRTFRAMFNPFIPKKEAKIMNMKRKEIKITEKMKEKFIEEFSKMMREFTPEEAAIFRRIKWVHEESQKAQFPNID